MGDILRVSCADQSSYKQCDHQTTTRIFPDSNNGGDAKAYAVNKKGWRYVTTGKRLSCAVKSEVQVTHFTDVDILGTYRSLVVQFRFEAGGLGPPVCSTSGRGMGCTGGDDGRPVQFQHVGELWGTACVLNL